jgi:hypothetical protein
LIASALDALLGVVAALSMTNNNDTSSQSFFLSDLILVVNLLPNCGILRETLARQVCEFLPIFYGNRKFIGAIAKI